MPGESDERLVVAAPRDCAEGPCAASTAAATAALLELVDSFAGAPREKTLMFVSLGGSAAGAAGAKELARELEASPAEAVLVLGAMGAAEPRAPYVVPWSSGPQSASIGLAESAAAAAGAEVGPEAGMPRGTTEALLRLAIPAGLGDQAPLIEGGQEAVALSSAGDRPLDPGSDEAGDLSATTLDGFGRAALSLTFALDEADAPPEHGPGAYVPLAGKLIPDWAISLLALALLLPVGVVSLEALVRSARRGEHALLAVAWTLAQALPFLGALLAAYALAEAGLLPRPEFPFDPGRVAPGPEAIPPILILGALFTGLVVLAVRRLGLPEAAAGTAAPAIGSLIFAALLAIWAANPFFALLLAPLGHLWLLASVPDLRGRPGAAAVLAAGGAVVPLIAVAAVGAQLGSGIQAPWDLLLMFTGRHFGPLVAVPLCILGGCLVALLAAAASPWPLQATPARRSGVLGPGAYAGPGSLGGTESALPRR
jgi:hypothetical protein